MTGITEPELRRKSEAPAPKTARALSFGWVFGLLLLGGISSFLGQRVYEGMLVTKPATVSTLEQARITWEKNQDLKSLVAYGQELDKVAGSLGTVREELQKKFYHMLAVEVGKKYNLKPNIVYAVWMKESKVNPAAKGDGHTRKDGTVDPTSFHAFGLGQIHLPTAQYHYDSTMTKDRLMDPVENGFACGKVLRDYTDMLGGDILWGISAYQQGPAPAQSQKRGGGLPANMRYVWEVMNYSFAVD